jgi:ATP-dependent RNA helicase RhlE
MTFSEFGLAEPIVRAVSSKGYSNPTPVQSQAIPPVLEGRDLFVCAPTGTGKTAAFALPILHRLQQNQQGKNAANRFIRTLVLAPTRELALQISQSFQTYGRHTGIRSTVIFGGVSQHPQVRSLQQGIAVLVATPGRLLDLMSQGFVDLSRVEILVLDEADRMLDMGFVPDVRRVIAKLRNDRQTLLFSATLPEAIEELASSILRDPQRISVVPTEDVSQLIDQSVYFVPREHKAKVLTKFLSNCELTRALVFTRTRRGADRVVKHLSQAGFRAAALHGDKSQSVRQRTLADFRSNHTPILVATDVAARGIDVIGISHVLNYDMPQEAETYVHRIGRTGRAGVKGCAISFCDQEERFQLKAIQRLIRRTLPEGDGLDLGSFVSPKSVAASTRRVDSRKAYKSRSHRRFASSKKS